jgi:hypothetical protein
MTMTRTNRALIDEAEHIEQRLLAIAVPAARPLLNRLSGIRGAACADGLDRLLLVAAMVLLDVDR